MELRRKKNIKEESYNYEKDPNDLTETKRTGKFSAFPKVLPVKPEEGIESKPLHPNLPKPPTCLLMVSPVKTGKSTIISNLLLNDNFYGQDYFDDRWNSK